MEETAETVDTSQPNIREDKDGPFASEYAEIRLYGTSCKEFYLDSLSALSLPWHELALTSRVPI